MSAVADCAVTMATIGDFVFRRLFLLTQNRVLWTASTATPSGAKVLSCLASLI